MEDKNEIMQSIQNLEEVLDQKLSFMQESINDIKNRMSEISSIKQDVSTLKDAFLGKMTDNEFAQKIAKMQYLGMIKK
ncbi:TPA: hypothetical protein R5723_000193 [Campylobacter jejuni]|nr:hypothetical protein [Campylobacter jejuni]ECL3806381.1 hypothetical protein [Campylobacter jejuni]ECP8671846.1 hypothetical protein [Campylobacter jejuni]ECP8719627.1 hypothetical protein [Campylobacter jejuni]ECP8882525.1 hypothetical protein [Campylobacter jejuni]